MTGDVPEPGIDLDVDPMLFFAAVIEDQEAVLNAIDSPEFDALAGPGMVPLSMGVAMVAREHLHSAQEQLDRLVEADETWRPA